MSCRDLLSVFGTFRDLDEGVDPRLHVFSGVPNGRELEPGGKGNNKIDLGAVANLGEALPLNYRVVLLQLERSDAVDVVVGDLQHIVRLGQIRRVDPIDHTLVVMEVLERIRGDAKVLEDALFHVEHGTVVGVDGIGRLVGEQRGIRDPVDVDVEEGHEDPDDEAWGSEIRISQGVTERVFSALDVQDAFIRRHCLLIKYDSVGRGEETTRVRVGRTHRVPEEVILRNPTDRLVAERPDLSVKPLLQTRVHVCPPFCGAFAMWRFGREGRTNQYASRLAYSAECTVQTIRRRRKPASSIPRAELRCDIRHTLTA